MSDIALLDRVEQEVSEIKEFNGTAPGQPVQYEPLAINREGFTD